MDIFDFALKMELDGEKYYRELAKNAQHDELRVVLDKLADDEQRHYDIIKAFQEQAQVDISDSDSLTGGMANIFANRSTAQNTGDIPKLKDEQIDIYKAALVKENESIAVYDNLKTKTDSPDIKAICEKLANEEKRHAQILETIIEMLNNVNDWVEAAEFNPKRAF